MFHRFLAYAGRHRSARAICLCNLTAYRSSFMLQRALSQYAFAKDSSMTTLRRSNGSSSALPAMAADAESITCYRSISPPSQPRRTFPWHHPLARRVRRFLLPVAFSVFAGNIGVGTYFAAFPRERSIKLLPPWSEEAPFIIASFLFVSGTTLLVLSRVRRIGPATP